MYLIGDFTDRDWFSTSVKMKKDVTKHDLGQSKQDSSFHVINMETGEYFDPYHNTWEKFKHE